MQKFITLCLQCQDAEHGAVEEHLNPIIAAGWRITSIHNAGSVVTASGPAIFLAILLEQGNPNDFNTQFPTTTAGVPVEPSDVPVTIDTPLEVGSRVLSFSQGRWWRATVISLESDDQVKIHYPGWGSEWDVVVAREELQMDLSEMDDEE